jgi:hypothetical protein
MYLWVVELGRCAVYPVFPKIVFVGRGATGSRSGAAEALGIAFTPGMGKVVPRGVTQAISATGGALDIAFTPGMGLVKT